jgi:hypothetical protein
MNYQKIYDSIIHQACLQNRVRNKLSYYEEHHIIPKCLGGSNDKSNLVLLTAREHFICHHLLVRIHPTNPKLVHAFWLMCNIKNPYQDRYIPSSISYQEARELNSKLGVSDSTKDKMSKSHMGHSHSLETRKKIASSNSKPKARTTCPHCKKDVSTGTNSHVWHFDNCKNKPGNENLIRKSPNSGIIVQCTYCKKSGGANVMQRWHFENCKNKNLVTTI